MIQKLPPQNLDAEMSVLGTLMKIPGAIDQVIDRLKPDDFYRDAHSEIYRAILVMASENKAIDLVTVISQLKDQKNLDEVGGPVYLATLTDVVPSTANLLHYAKIVRDKSTLRKIITAFSTAIGQCYDSPLEVEDILSDADAVLFGLSGASSPKEYMSTQEITPKVFKEIEQRHESKGALLGIPTGLTDLDRMTSGFQSTDLIILAGRPSMGKTALAMNIATHAARFKKIPIGVFSLEMAKEDLVERNLCSVGRVNSHRVRTGRIHDNDWPKLTRAAGIMAELPIYIDESGSLSILELRARARRMQKKHDIGLVVIDYLQLMSGGLGKGSSREQEISEISRSLKAMAKELKLPVLALSQLNRSLESRPNKRPLLSDLRESGAIEQDADLILFVYRDDYYNQSEDNPRRGIAEIIIGKQRKGPTGTVESAWDKETTTFLNYANAEGQSGHGWHEPA